MDIRKVKKLIDLLEQSNVNEIEISEGDQSVRISRASKTEVAQSVVQPVAPAAAPVAPPAAPAAAPSDAASPAPSAAPEAASDPGVQTVHSPMVGTFYAASSPDAEPFVVEGQAVKKDEVVCIIEAMKTMNQITAPEDGVVVKIHANNGDPIEYNQPLVDIKKA